MKDKLWGGRFKKDIDRDFFVFQESFSYDYRLIKYDIYHSLIHITALKESGILTEEEYERLFKALKDILKEVEKGFIHYGDYEDVHTYVQKRVESKVGRLSLKLHTFRSRNDQIVFDERLYCYEKTQILSRFLKSLISSLECLAKRYKDIFIVGYTHSRRAQALPFSTYIRAFTCMLRRDLSRLSNFSKNLCVYIGAGALAGTPISREVYRKAIKKVFKSLKLDVKYLDYSKNSVDSVSDRDFIIEFLSILSIIQMHLSRLAEDFILYSTEEFNFFDLPEEFCTGSSLLPHKKNPDLLELVRGYSGVIYGNLISILTIMKGIPLSYNRDMQLDKKSLFSSEEIVEEELKLLVRFVKKIKLNKKNIEKALEDESLFALDLLAYLVKEGVPFKEAHNCIGKLIRYSCDNNIKIKDMQDKLLSTFHKKLNRKVVNSIMNFRYKASSSKKLS